MGADCAVHMIKFLAAHDVTHVTDPFCGKGTVLAAANAFGLSAQGVDVSAKQGAARCSCNRCNLPPHLTVLNVHPLIINPVSYTHLTLPTICSV